MLYVILIIAILVMGFFAYQTTKKSPNDTVEIDLMAPTPEDLAPLTEKKEENPSDKLLKDLEADITNVEAEKKKIEAEYARLSAIESPDKNKPFAKLGGVQAPKESTPPTTPPVGVTASSTPKKKRKYNKGKGKGNNPTSTPPTPQS